ncbi:MAG: hypothetical protein KAS48_01820 [Gammaproteobacteria bacterium]|nr:hypothetical protein [Gammaproteobacteria bacterium]MCK5091547.1 hypothetical protein [Gammaproteobacteria bacterium]
MLNDILKEHFDAFIKSRGIQIKSIMPKEMPAWCQKILIFPEIPQHVAGYVDTEQDGLLLVFVHQSAFKEPTFSMSVYEKDKNPEIDLYANVKGDWIKAPDLRLS